MSRVTNVILTFSLDEEEAIRELSTALTAFTWYGGRPLTDAAEVDGLVAGSKAMECGICLGAFNYFDLSEFLTAIRNTSWKYPCELQLFIKEQEDDWFRQVHDFEGAVKRRSA